MCGIAGIFGEGVGKRAGILERMLEVMRYRGPDDWGRFDGERLVMGMRRLSIIDLNSGHQPISNEDGRVVVILNGEIYNYRELRGELVAKGHVFRTESDTEVLVHLYEEHGEEVPNYLNGMFAFAIWDEVRKKLVLARDHMGIKPLYWMRDNEGLLFFASEVKCLLECGARRRLDREALAAYMQLGYVPGEQTVFEGVRRLSPGHVLVCDERNEEPVISAYWRLRDCFGEERREGAEEGAERVECLIRDAVKRQLRSDVPVGCFLSGGLDSSMITAFAARELDGLDTFSVRFADHHFDETPYSSAVAKALGTRHHVLEVSSDEMLGSLDELVWYVDEPNWDPAILPSYVVSRYARERVKVALSGTGGDEVFGGYRRHWEPYGVSSRADSFRACVPSELRKFLLRIMELPGCSGMRCEKAMRLLYDNREVAFGYGITLDSGGGLGMIAPGMRKAFSILRWLRNVQREVAGCDEVNRMLYCDAMTYLSDQLLPMLDRTSMAVSLESRVPLLDVGLVEYMAGIRGADKVRPNIGKLHLMAVARKYLPDEVVDRPKIGFGVPVRRWMQHETVVKKLSGVCGGILPEFGVVDADEFRRAVKDSERRDANASLLWGIMMLDLWTRRCWG